MGFSRGGKVSDKPKDELTIKPATALINSYMYIPDSTNCTYTIITPHSEAIKSLLTALNDVMDVRVSPTKTIRSSKPHPVYSKIQKICTEVLDEAKKREWENL